MVGAAHIDAEGAMRALSYWWPPGTTTPLVVKREPPLWALGGDNHQHDPEAEYRPARPTGGWDPWILVLYGRVGAGKTAVQTAIGKEHARLYEEHRTGQIVISNYWISWLHDAVGGLFRPLVCDIKGCPHEEPECYAEFITRRWHPRMMDIISSYPPPAWAHRYLFLLDELADVFSVWGAMSNRTRDGVAALRQIRKSQGEMVACTTHPGRVAAAMTERGDVFGLVEPIPCIHGRLKSGCPVCSWRKPTHARVSLYQFDGRPLPESSEERTPIRTLRVRIEDVLDDYDTYNWVAPSWAPPGASQRQAEEVTPNGAI